MAELSQDTDVVQDCEGYPGMTERERESLMPIITSKRQSVKCSTGTCNTRIFPPRKYCEKCMLRLQKKTADVIKRLRRNKRGYDVPDRLGDSIYR